jgi:hypothetical protein
MTHFRALLPARRELLAEFLCSFTRWGTAQADHVQLSVWSVASGGVSGGHAGAGPKRPHTQRGVAGGEAGGGGVRFSNRTAAPAW